MRSPGIIRWLIRGVIILFLWMTALTVAVSPIAVLIRGFVEGITVTVTGFGAWATWTEWRTLHKPWRSRRIRHLRVIGRAESPPPSSPASPSRRFPQ